MQSSDPSMIQDKKSNFWFGTFIVMMGLAIAAMIYFNPEGLNTPAWLAYTATGSIGLAGLSIVFKALGKTRHSAYMAGCILITFTVIGAWIGFGPGVRECSGTLFGFTSLVPDWQCRGVFGLSAIICALVTVFMWWNMLRGDR